MEILTKLCAFVILVCAIPVIAGHYSLRGNYVSNLKEDVGSFQNHLVVEPSIPRSRKRGNLAGEKHVVGLDDYEELEEVVKEAVESFSSEISYDIEIANLYNATKQVVAGMFYVIEAELKANRIQMNCTLKIWDRPYMRKGNSLTINCGPLGPITHSYTSHRHPDLLRNDNSYLFPDYDNPVDTHEANSVLKRQNHSSDSLKIYIRTLDGNTLHLHVDPNYTVAQLKDKIHENNENMTKTLPLYFDGQTLEDSRTLQSYHLTKNSVLHFGRVY